jgi:hypothetical protein
MLIRMQGRSINTAQLQAISIWQGKIAQGKYAGQVTGRCLPAVGSAALYTPVPPVLHSTSCLVLPPTDHPAILQWLPCLTIRRGQESC